VGVLSHWFIDALVHRPDMPLTPGAGSAKVGLSVWNQPALTVVLELLFYGAGIAVYRKTTRAVDRTGTWALWSLIVFLAAAWAGAMLGRLRPTSESSACPPVPVAVRPMGLDRPPPRYRRRLEGSMR
jgi:hypothetical protein